NAVDVSALSSGIYLIRFQNGNVISISRFIIE
ncbi:MAG: T9SS type A sorting domain-containing protein, partial [Saprospiraceae bacterium]